MDAALRDVKSQEEARDSKTADLTRKSGVGGLVQQNKAKNELAQHMAEDPLPLRRAKITLEAALKKAEKVIITIKNIILIIIIPILFYGMRLSIIYKYYKR